MLQGCHIILYSISSQGIAQLESFLVVCSIFLFILLHVEVAREHPHSSLGGPWSPAISDSSAADWDAGT